MKRAGALLLLALPAFAQTADQIIQRELQTSQAYDTLSHLTDEIGPRLSGSRGAAASVAWTTARFRAPKRAFRPTARLCGFQSSSSSYC